MSRTIFAPCLKPEEQAPILSYHPFLQQSRRVLNPDVKLVVVCTQRAADSHFEGKRACAKRAAKASGKM